MNKKYKFSFVVLASFMVIYLSGCYYDAVLPPLTPEIETEISFNKDIIPIFNKSCNGSGCHNIGGTKPDLTAANAYNALKNGNYFNISAAESSEIYKWMKGEKGLPMPLSGPNSEYNAKILAWIKQGALNN